MSHTYCHRTLIDVPVQQMKPMQVMKRWKRCCSSLVAIFILGLLLTISAAESDMDIIRERLVASLLDTPVDKAQAKNAAEHLQADGRWPDLDYNDKERASWKTSSHIDRCLLLARAWHQEGATTPNPLLAASLLGLSHWIEKDYTNPNWWHNEIGVPWKMGDLLLVLGDQVPEAQRQRAIQVILMRAKIGMTGQNTVWLAGNTVRRALLTNDAPLLSSSLNVIFKEIAISTKEGIQPDASFHQHGPQLQWGNYGLSFLGDQLKWAEFVHGTAFSLSDKRRDILRHYLFNGLVWSTWHEAMDTACIGRQFAPDSQRRKGRGVLGRIDAWVKIDPEAADSCTKLRTSLDGSGPNTLIGNRHFWRSDVTIQRNAEWQATLKLCSTRVIGAELVNSENQRGRYLGQGLLSILQDGDEYENIYPLWNWSQLPGTTTRIGSDPALPRDGKKNLGPENFVGGASDERCAIIGQNYRENITSEVSAKRAWFFTDRGVICLGAGISCRTGSPQTNVEQILSTGPLQWASATESGIIDGLGETTQSLRVLTHRNRSYVFLEAANCHVQIEDRREAWSTITPVAGSKTASGRVMSLRILHDKVPASYAYAVLPGIDELKEAEASAARFTILANTSQLQAVSHGGVVGIIFHSAGSLETEAGLVSVDAPAAVLLRKELNAWHAHVADPSQTLANLTLQLGDWKQTLALPQDGMAGSSLVVDIP